MNFLLNLYGGLLDIAAPALDFLLKQRLAKGKEDPLRVPERRGMPGLFRPAGKLIWIHGASVGEAQSTLILIDHLRRHFPEVPILLTTGTVTSARYLAERLPTGVIHQYYPLDRPQWVRMFLDHWQPDFVLWMESELWPAMLSDLQKRKIPAILLNARMSARSLRRWETFTDTAKCLLQTFTSILTQTENDAAAYLALGARNVSVSGNLKYAAAPLPVNEKDLAALKIATQGRPVWLYASTHAGEEELGCRLHQQLDIPGLLTIIVPRHPERRDEVLAVCQNSGLKTQLRTESKISPASDTQIYIADTLGELGLFYRLAPLACIGRSFSSDGGGGHNPIEAAQLGCAVLHGPGVYNLREIYQDMDQAGAARLVKNETNFSATLKILLTQQEQLDSLAQAGKAFTQDHGAVLDHVLAQILPVAEAALIKKAEAV